MIHPSVTQGPLDLLYDNAIKDILSLCTDLVSDPNAITLIVMLCTTQGAQAIREAGGKDGDFCWFSPVQPNSAFECHRRGDDKDDRITPHASDAWLCRLEL